MKAFISLTVAALFAAWATIISAQTLDGISFEIQPGKQFTFLGPQGSGKSTLIQVTAGFISVGEGRDLIFADLDRRDIYAPGPAGGLMSMREMMARFANTNGAVQQGTGGDGASVDDPDAAFDALLDGLPPTMKRQLRAQFQALPRDQAIMALQVLRGQMNLPAVDLNTVPQNTTPVSGVEKTGNTQDLNGLTLHEYIAAGDRVWAVDADRMDGGAQLVESLAAMGEIFNEISEGLPVEDSSFFRIGELDGRAPYHVMTQDGESFTYDSTSDVDVRVPKF